ncbi:MAG TPA: sulfatase-like hydrolase/transferase [Tissierellaceae bacterium]|nr:sulfatase-like hydrolase/transferase [Tissierellaceae bacterium]
MILLILLILKNLLFMNITNIIHNRITIFTLSELITLFLFSIIYFSKYKRKRTLGFVIYSIISLIMFVDIMYYSFYNTLPSIVMLKHIGQVAAVGESVRDLLSFKNLLFVLDIPLLIIAYNILKKKTKIKEKQYSMYIQWAVPLVLIITLLGFFLNLNKRCLIGPISNQELYTYHAKDIKKVIFKDDLVESIDLFSKEDFDNLKERTKLKRGKHTGIGKDRNLIVIQVEALQNFVINRPYNGQIITPNLNKLIKDSGTLYFDNYYQLIGKGNTSDAEFISNNSLHPSMEDPTYTQYEENAFYGLPWILRDRDYNVWAFHGFKKEFWNRERAYVNQGYQRFLSDEDYDILETTGIGITDKEFYKQSMDYIKELDSIDSNPFYAFLLTLTSHTPFEISEELRFLNIEEEYQDTILGHYLQSIHYADLALGEFVENLKEEGLYDNSLIAIYGDHFAITAFKNSTAEIMTDYLGYPYDVDEMFKIPLIVNIPGERINETISDVGSQLDFMPTILNLMGYENKKGIMFGRDLVNHKEYNFVAPQYYISKGSFIDDEVLFTASKDCIFENCTAKDLKTRESLDVESLRAKHENAINEINKSDYILRNDLIKEMIENWGELDFTSLFNRSIPSNRYIKNSYTDPIEELNQGYDAHFRILSVELEWAKDKKDVYLKNHGTSIDDLANWMLVNSDAYIVLRTQEDDRSLLLEVQKKYSGLKDRFIVEMNTFNEYINLTHKAYKNVFLNLSDTQYTENEIKDFINKNNLAGVIMDEKLGKTKLPRILKEMNVHTYVEGVDSKFKMKILERKQVYGFFVNKI